VNKHDILDDRTRLGHLDFQFDLLSVCFGLLNDSIFYIIFWHSPSYRLLFKRVRLIGDFPPFSGASRGEFGVKNEKRLPNQVWEPFSAKFDYADGGTRTRTALLGQRILSPLRYIDYQTLIKASVQKVSNKAIR